MVDVKSTCRRCGILNPEGQFRCPSGWAFFPGGPGNFYNNKPLCSICWKKYEEWLQRKDKNYLEKLKKYVKRVKSLIKFGKILGIR